jgi:hypothetical protein
VLELCCDSEMWGRGHVWVLSDFELSLKYLLLNYGVIIEMWRMVVLSDFQFSDSHIYFL